MFFVDFQRKINFFDFLFQIPSMEMAAEYLGRYKSWVPPQSECERSKNTKNNFKVIRAQAKLRQNNWIDDKNCLVIGTLTAEHNPPQ